MNIKARFPIFKTNENLVYLDNAATTQKPTEVIDAIVDFYQNHNSNIHRGMYPLAERATELYESARENVARFIGAKPEEIIFNGGTTDGINALCFGLQRSNIVTETPKILLSEIEHHSNLLPWRFWKDAKIDYIPVDKSTYNLDFSGINISDYDIISLSHVSNVTGGILDIEYINKNRKQDSLLILDSAQAVAHIPMDVKSIKADFIVFSGHKLYGPTGIGVLYGKAELLEKLEPANAGGGMIESVGKDNVIWAKGPSKFEAGTPPIAQAIGLSAAINLIKDIGFDFIQQHETSLTVKLLEELSSVKDIEIYHADNGLGVVSFSIKGIHPHDISASLGDSNICVRAGHHCTQILHKDVLNIPASLRVSLGVYNEESDIQKLIERLGIIHTQFH